MSDNGSFGAIVRQLVNKFNFRAKAMKITIGAKAGTYLNGLFYLR
jgi:hypothetical protein